MTRSIDNCLRQQGYTVAGKEILLSVTDKADLRKIQSHHRNLRLYGCHLNFIKKHQSLALGYICNPQSINVSKIEIELIEVSPGTVWEKLFRWWCMVWWSIPYEKSIGRQIRFIVWDSRHQAIVGLIGLHSPILSWQPRDRYLNIDRNTRISWVNQSLGAQRVGAIPPYNQILGSRLIASLLVARDIRQLFENKYKERVTLIKCRQFTDCI